MGIAFGNVTAAVEHCQEITNEGGDGVALLKRIGQAIDLGYLACDAAGEISITSAGEVLIENKVYPSNKTSTRW